MSLAPQITKTPLPSLTEWLGDGARAEGFEDWVRETISLEHDVGTDEERAAIRMIQTLAIACMEVCRREHEQYGRSQAEALHLLARCCGVAVMSPVLSACHEAPRSSLHKLVRLLADDFKRGASLMVRGTAVTAGEGTKS